MCGIFTTLIAEVSSDNYVIGNVKLPRFLVYSDGIALLFYDIRYAIIIKYVIEQIFGFDTKISDLTEYNWEENKYGLQLHNNMSEIMSDIYNKVRDIEDGQK